MPGRSGSSVSSSRVTLRLACLCCFCLALFSTCLAVVPAAAQHERRWRPRRRRRRTFGWWSFRRTLVLRTLFLVSRESDPLGRPFCVAAFWQAPGPKRVRSIGGSLELHAFELVDFRCRRSRLSPSDADDAVMVSSHIAT